jgi:spore coat protein CotH
MKNSKNIIAILLICFTVYNTFGQVFTDSNLPIVVINTDTDPFTGLPTEIPDEPKILANMKIIYHSDGSRNYMTDINTDLFLNYNGRIGIETRGSTSQILPKKPYSITTLTAGSTTTSTTENFSLLGMPSENDWVLNSLAFDASLIRDNLSYYLARQMGNYSARTIYCEVVINGEYVGLYMLTEKLKADSNRINILKITASDNTLPGLSGGYITKADKTTGGDPIAWSAVAYNGGNVDYIHELPNPVNVTSQQDAYIQAEFNNLSKTAGANNSSLLNGYTKTIDVPTFVDFMVLNELASNVDGYQISSFFHKDRNGKLRAGPIWDFNLTYGNDLFFWGYDRSHTDVWQFSNGDNEGSRFWKDLFDSPNFRCYFAKRWNQLTQPGQPLNQTQIDSFIDSNILLLQEAMNREHQKWGTVPDHPQEVANMKTWITSRINWINNNIGGFASCANVPIPALVISQINYNPQAVTSPIAYASNDQEFIQITNNGSVTVNLSGIYFSQLGISYQFPYNSTLSAGNSIYLASNTTVFQNRFGFAAFGQFTRNLSNKSQNLVLSDAFGNEIDKVEYFDTTPWPTDPDGNGSYLQLIDNNLDNNLASSWVASSNILTNIEFIDQNIQLQIYPNPANEIVAINSKVKLDKIEIFDVLGKMVFSIKTNDFEINANINSLSAGLYFIKVFSGSKTKTTKFVKE